MTQGRSAAARVLGRVGRPHGRDGSFYLDSAAAPDAPSRGARVTVAGRERTVERRAGTRERPIIRLGGVDDRDAAAALGAEVVREPGPPAPLAEGEWAAEDLVGCRIDGLGDVRRVIAAPSCDLLEVGDAGHLVPLVSDAVALVDPDAGVIEIDRQFLGLPDEGSEPTPPGTR